MQPTELNASAASALATAPAVLELAESSRWRAPEVTAALAEQAVRLAEAGGDHAYALRAEGWVAHGLVAIGRGVAAVPRAVRALSEASKGRDLEAIGRLRVELAAVAGALGDRDTASALLAPVLDHADASLGLRADAHLEAARRGGAESPDGALESVGVAAGALRQLGGEYAELGLAAVDAVLARQERERGHVNGAMERAREGLRRVLGGGSGDGALDPVSPHLAAELSLELTLALLDGGQTEAVRELARSAPRWGSRPGVLVPVARLRLTLAQRVYLPAGEEDAALASAEWVSKAVESHDLPEIEVECHGLLAELLERRGELPFALAASRRAHEAYRLHAARVEQALVLLARAGSEAKLAEARRHPGRSRAQAGAGPSNQVADAITQINVLDGAPSRTGRPGAGEPSLPRRRNPLDSATRPSRQVPAPPPPGSAQRDPHRAEGAPLPSAVRASPASEATTQRDPHRAESAPLPSAVRASPASEATTSSWFASPNPPDSVGQAPARSVEGEPSGRRVPSVRPLLGTSWRRSAGADPRQPTGEAQARAVEAARQSDPECGRIFDDEGARPGDGEQGRLLDAEGGRFPGGAPSRLAPTEPIGPAFGARARSEAGPRRGPDERPGQPWTTGPISGSPVPGSTFDMGRVPAPGEGVRPRHDGPGGVGQPPVFAGGTEDRIPTIGGASGTAHGGPRAAPPRHGAVGAEPLAGGQDSGRRRPSAEPDAVPGILGNEDDRPARLGRDRDGVGDPGLDRPSEPGRWGGAERLFADDPGRRDVDEGDGHWFGAAEDEPDWLCADEGEGLWSGGVEEGLGAGDGHPEGAAGLLEAREPGHRAWSGDVHDGARRAPEAADWVALSVPELALRLAELASEAGQPAHLVLVDIVSPEGSGTGAEVAVLAGRIGELVRDQLPASARLYPLDGDAMAIGMPEADPEVVTRWVRSLSTGLSQRWPELAAELPRAVFRIGVRWLGGALSVEQHVRELRAGRVGVPSGSQDQSHPPVQLPGGTRYADLPTGGASGSTGEPDSGVAGVAPPGGRHGAGSTDPEPSSAVTSTNRVSALPGSGGRRRRAEGPPDDGLAPATPAENGIGRPASAPFRPASGAPGGSGRYRGQPASTPSSAQWTAPTSPPRVGAGAGGHAVPDDGGSPANGSRLSGAAMNGHTGLRSSHAANGHSAPAAIAGVGSVRDADAEATGRFAAGAASFGDTGANGAGMSGRTALADPGAPARQRHHRDPLSSPEPTATGPDHDTHAWRATGEPEPNGTRPMNGLADANGRASGAPRANGYHIVDAVGGENGRRPDTGGSHGGHDGPRAPGRHAKPSGDALDAAAGSPVTATSGGIGAVGGVEARTPAAPDERTAEPGARPARRRTREDASPPASQDGSGAGRSVSELSFAELLAGALAAYREA